MSRGHSLRVGLCGIGLDAYWSQFVGLEQRLKGYMAQVASQLMRPGVEVVNLGLVDTPQRSCEAGHQCRREDIDVLFLYVTTYALSNTVLPLV
jgi:L-arabinose isomerase